ncbi:mucin-3A-like [Anneissia japonica]|uniref:mucin-3A-like n=1 Tax=Anneissia japonica TaxID=1529436 RepID=UPI0014259C47|nr:mucin-3A-like [Anneissia japonica]
MEDGRIDKITGPIQNADLTRLNSNLTEPIVWVPNPYLFDEDVWIVMTLPSLSEVTAIALHGGQSENGDDRRFIRYFLKYQYHGETFLYLDNNGSTMYFPGNFQPNHVLYNLLPKSIICDQLTFTGTHWQNTLPGLRIELYGCPATDSVESTSVMLSSSPDQRSTAMPSFTETTQVNFISITAPTTVIQLTTEHNAAAIDPTTAPNTANIPTTVDSTPAAGSNPTTTHEITHTFPGNFQPNHVRYNLLPKSIICHKLTFTGTHWQNTLPGLRIELYGCPATDTVESISVMLSSSPDQRSTAMPSFTETTPVNFISITAPTTVIQLTTEHSADAIDPTTAPNTANIPTTVDSTPAAGSNPTTTHEITHTANHPITDHEITHVINNNTNNNDDNPITTHEITHTANNPTTDHEITHVINNNTNNNDDIPITTHEITHTANNPITDHEITHVINNNTNNDDIPITTHEITHTTNNPITDHEITHVINNNTNNNDAIPITTHEITHTTNNPITDHEITHVNNNNITRPRHIGDGSEGSQSFLDEPRSSESNHLTSSIFTTTSANNLISNHIENMWDCKSVTCVNAYVSSVHQVMNMSINTLDDELLLVYFDFIETVLNINLTNKDILSDVLHELDFILNLSNVQLRQSIEKNDDITSKLLSTVESLIIEFVLKSPEEEEIKSTKALNVRWVDLKSEGRGGDSLKFTKKDEQVVGAISASNFTGKYDYLLVIVYESLHLIRPIEEHVGTHVTSVNLFSRSGNVTTELPLSDALFLQLKITLSGDFKSPNCSFWDLKESYWSDDGCVVSSYNDSWVTCFCDHLTSFAVLMQVSEVDIGEDNDEALRIITLIGVSISIVCLIFTLMTYTLLR